MELEVANRTDSCCMINEQGRVMEEKRSWADLPDDILCVIFSRLFGGDRIMFRCVCRSWKPIIAYNTSIKIHKFPPNNNTASLSGPYLIYPNGKNVIRPIYDEFHHANLFIVPGAIIHAEKGGWFLMTRIDEIFLFNPLTNEKVDLPKHGEKGRVRAAYISAPPTSTSWTIIFSTCVHFVIIWTIKRGENKWSKSCEREQWFDFRDASSLVVCKGLYYFLADDAELLIHDPKKNSFEFYEAPKSVIYEQLRTDNAQHYLLESDGKVWGVFVSCDGALIRICQWNARKKTWEILKTLGDKMVYVSRSSSICERATIKGTGNKIYFPRLVDDNHCLFYSLSTKKYHTFVPGSSYGSFNGSKHPRSLIWIKL